MQSFWKKFQSPRTLIIFESAARLGSFTRAAEELAIQQPSVSAAIRQLEDTLGTVLFVRAHRNVTLTAAGARLFAGVSRSLSGLEAAITATQELGRNLHVTLSTSSAFSYYWMMPRLSAFHTIHPDIDLRLQTSDRDVDLNVENISLGIRVGNGNWAGHDAAKIADEIIYPVAHPRVMQSARNLRSIPNLMNERLIHLEEPIRERPTWNDWFAHHNIANRDIHAGLRLNDYALVLQAAVSGEGFAFGWDHIVRNLLERGLLLARKDWAWNTGRGVYLVWARDKQLSAHAINVRDWIIHGSDFPSMGIGSA